jgi:hypothetical protein
MKFIYFLLNASAVALTISTIINLSMLILAPALRAGFSLIGLTVARGLTSLCKNTTKEENIFRVASCFGEWHKSIFILPLYYFTSSILALTTGSEIYKGDFIYSTLCIFASAYLLLILLLSTVNNSTNETEIVNEIVKNMLGSKKTDKKMLLFYFIFIIYFSTLLFPSLAEYTINLWLLDSASWLWDLYIIGWIIKAFAALMVVVFTLNILMFGFKEASGVRPFLILTLLLASNFVAAMLNPPW